MSSVPRVFTSLALAAAAITADSHPTHAETARGLVATVSWGALVTTSNRTEASHPGDAFGNPNSFADVGGVPYIYASSFDASFVDTAGDNKRVSLTISEAALVDAKGVANLTACRVGDGFGDPENPPCARLVLSGVVSAPPVGTAEEVAAKAALFERHPSFAKYPTGHDFFVAKITIDGIWMIDAYGGATIMALPDYFAAQPAPPSDDRGSLRAVKGPPIPTHKIATARWLTKYLDWGVLSTTSTRSQGTSVGTAFGNPYSFADVRGTIYLYASDLDASMIDLFQGNGTVVPSPRASLALSEASFPGTPLSRCVVGGSLGDPESPLCARLVLSGVMSKVAYDSDEETEAKAALEARHPSFAQFPPGHSFYVAKLDLDGIWLIDIFGGAAIIEPADYFKATEPSR